MENLVTITIRSTHYYLIDGAFMVDTGWAGSLPALQSQLSRYGIKLSDIRYVMITHHHPDHAGLTQEIKDAGQARLMILEHQIPFLEQLTAFHAKKGDSFVSIRVEPGDLVLKRDNRADLNKLGLRGEIVATPGHSDDSVSLVLDSGLAFIGDLHPPAYVMDDAAQEVTRQSWQKLLELNVRQVYPAHGSSPIRIEDIPGILGK